MSARTITTSAKLLPSILSEDQQVTIDHIYNNDYSFVVAPTGGGKTVVALTSFKELADNLVHVNRLLVIAPLKPAQTAWANECDKWAHLCHLTVTLAIGKPEDRKAAINCDSDIVVINNENVKWFFQTFKHNHDFDMLVIDELSKWKSSGGAGFKAMRPYIKDFGIRVGMTATPVAEDWTGLFAQLLLVDGGERLGRNKDRYLRQYFYPTDYEQRNWELLPGRDKALSEKIADIVHIMPDYKGALPPCSINHIYLDMPAEAVTAYDTFKKDMVLDVDDVTVEVPNMAVLTAKLQQIANGFLYVDGETQTIHHEKQMKASRLIDHALMSNQSIVVVYQYQAELEWLKKRWPGTPVLNSKLKTNEFDAVLKDWQRGVQKIVFIHPKSAGHGLDGLQLGGARMLWLSPVWSRDLFEQTIGRLWRRGQKEAVRIDVLLSSNTVDDVIIKAQEAKAEYHELLLAHLG